MFFNYSNPEGNQTYYGNRTNPFYGYSADNGNNRSRFLSSTYAYKGNSGMLKSGSLYNTSHGGLPIGRGSAYSGKNLPSVSAASHILRNKMIQIKDHQNGVRSFNGGSKNSSNAKIMKKGASHFSKSYGKSLSYGKNYPANNSNVLHKSVYSYIDYDINNNKMPGFKSRNSDYKSLFDVDNDEDVIRAREEFKKDRKQKQKNDYKNTYLNRKKVKM